MNEILDRIKVLEKEALNLEPDFQRRSSMREEVVRYTEAFLNEIDVVNAYRPPRFNAESWELARISEGASNDTASLTQFIQEEIDLPGLNPASGGHLGHIPGGGLYPSALGDYMADISNRFSGVFLGSPGAVRLETMLVEWLSELFGYPDSAGGTLTSGGSIANLIGIVTARDAKGIKSNIVPRSVIYMTEQAHHCVGKALRIAGLGEALIRHVPMDLQYRMDTKALESQIERDLSRDLVPWLIVASVGTTDTGAVDPLDTIANLAEHYTLWLHLDAAYGGFFILCDETRALFNGIEKADSIVIDPHKGLFLPYGTGAIIVKNRDLLYESHYYQANYMQDALKDRGQILSPADLSPELTRHFRGLRLWMPLKIFGLKSFRAGLEEKIWLARYFYQKIRTIPGIETGPYPELSVVCFRFVPESGDADSFNSQLVAEIHSDGRVFMSSTRIQGIFFIRVAILCFRSHLHTIDLSLEVVKTGIERVKKRTSTQ